MGRTLRPHDEVPGSPSRPDDRNQRLRQRYRWGGRDEETIPCSIKVPEEKLFNVSAYKPGDYKQFFQDSRTRAGYLKWAALLLSAEEYQDDRDSDAYHVLAFEGGGRLVGAGRILADGAIGYIAVLRPWRGYTVGGAILAYLLHIAKTLKIQIVSVKSLLNVTAFFEKNGFLPVDTTAEDKDLTLLKMVRSVNRSERSASVH